MKTSVSDDQKARDGVSSRPLIPGHRKIIEELLVAVQKQQDVMARMNKDLEFFRTQYKSCLDYDNGTGCYLEDTGYGDESIDLRSYEDIGNGTITADTAIAYLGYESAMDNFELGFKKGKDEIEKIWDRVGEVSNPEHVQLKIEDWAADGLEVSRKATDGVEAGRKAAGDLAARRKAEMQELIGVIWEG